MKYVKKTKPALWTTLPAAQRRQEAVEEARKRAKAAFSAIKRGKAAAKPRQRLKPRSSAMEARMKDYRAAKARFLAAYPSCQCGCGRKSKEVHHRFGRNGDLLLWKTGWLAVCVDCHLWIHSHIDLARERNLIALPGEWNNKKVIDKQPACA